MLTEDSLIMYRAAARASPTDGLYLPGKILFRKDGWKHVQEMAPGPYGFPVPKKCRWRRMGKETAQRLKTGYLMLVGFHVTGLGV